MEPAPRDAAVIGFRPFPHRHRLLNALTMKKLLAFLIAACFATCSFTATAATAGHHVKASKKKHAHKKSHVKRVAHKAPAPSTRY